MPTVGFDASTVAGQYPSGGSAGQMLVKTDSTNYNAAWSTGSSDAGTIVYSGAYYDNKYLPGQSNVTVAVTAGTTLYMPIWFSAAWKVTQLAVWALTASGASLTAAICSNNGVNQPGSLIVITNTFLASVVGSVASNVSSTVIPAGWAWVAIGYTGAATNLAGTSSTLLRPLIGSSGPAQTMNHSYIDTTSGVPKANPTVTPSAATTVPTVWFRAG